MSEPRTSVPALAALAEVLPDWEAPPQVRAFVTGRRGGVSRGPWGLSGGLAGGLNLGARCGDDPVDVAANRARLNACLPAPPLWLDQVHGATVHVVDAARAGALRQRGVPGTGLPEPVADAAVTAQPGVVLAVLTADCLPVLLADSRGRAVAVAHAGWRGLALGVLERTVEALRHCAGSDAQLLAWFGPAIGPASFEVGEDVLRAFCDDHPDCAAAFVPGARDGKWLADLYRLARIRLGGAGVSRVWGGGHCTLVENERFFSYRHDPRSGRMASLIWLDPR